MESALVKESVNSSVGDDDKIYFFFTEKSQEHSLYSSYSKVARVARVCKVQHKALLFLAQIHNLLSTALLGQRCEIGSKNILFI